MLPLSLAIYAFVRPQLAAGDQRVLALLQEFGTIAAVDRHCEACGARTEAEWLRCPTCASWLATPCDTCARWSDASLELCPWCGGESRATPFVPDLVPAAVPIVASVTTIAGGDGVAAAVAEPGAERRTRMPWRLGSPSVPRSQRVDNRRMALAPDGRRVNRTRVRA